MSRSSLTIVREEIFSHPVAPEPVAEGSHGFVEERHREFPPIIIVAVTNVCDMACIHCAHPVIKQDPGYRGRFMDQQAHTRIVEEVAHFTDQLWVFRYAADGESLLHPRFLEFVDEAKAAGIAPVDLTTNAMSLTEEKTRRLLEAPIDVIDVSLDAYTKETYEKIRLGGDFARVVGNLERLIEMRNKLASPTRIMTSIIEQNEAIEEVEAFKCFWGQYADEVIVRGLNTDLGIVNVTETYFRDDIARWPCPQFWKRVTINERGDLRFCVEDWRNTGIVSNILEESIQEVWKGAIYDRLRHLHSTGKWSEVSMCKNCLDWQHMEWDHGFEKAINRVMNQA